ncbi:hypothetical protein BDQ12DRAFT_759846 [Crucibulum laeve]|uniref:TPR-like protein n=1 Tax=Crucibulum laeve TaxID=68775 RepID=A0A5C3LTU6_9AGAR|nr:hypothetical protein BDQ12DRAFT_759846 [Crucibulum laeve]
MEPIKRVQRAHQLKAPSKTQDLLQYGAIAASMLKEIAEATGVPCLKTIAGLTTLIIQTVETVRYNKDECIRMTERTYWLICAIINICKNTEAELPPDMVRNIEQFQDTLQKLLSYHALDVFGVQSHVITAVTLAEMQENASRRHQELMDVLSSQQAALPSGTTPEDLRRSSSTLSLLPASPLIFTGRDKEQQEIITIMKNNTAARIVVLGPGGIGKTSLTLSVLHHHTIVDIFEPALMVLDNFETPWEIPEQRSKVENFLALLANISHQSIVLTMRGVERPGKIRWTRPFLAPLEPLTDDAAEEIFRDISDLNNDDPDLIELLKLTDNLPLAVTLMAHLAESETCANILSRWKQENTSLLSDGMDKISNLEKSISISISSPRMENTPHALELLSLLALLPDGISEVTLLQMKLPFDNVSKCRFILVLTSLSYVDSRGRVKALAPIREYTRTYHPPPNDSLQSLNTYVYQILDVWTANCDYPSQHRTDAISNELGNIYSILDYNFQIAQDYANSDFQTNVGALNEQVEVIIFLSYMAEDPIKALNIARKAVSMATHGSIEIHVQCRAFAALSHALLNSGYINNALHVLQEPEDLSRATGNLYCEIFCIRIHVRAYAYLGKFQEAIMLCNHAAQICDASGVKPSALEPVFMNLTLVHGHILFLKSEYRHCREVWQKLFEIFRSEYLHDTLPHAVVLHNLIDLDIATGRTADPQMQINSQKLQSMAELLSCYQLGCTHLLPWSWSQIYFEKGDLKNAALQCLESLRSPSTWQIEEARPPRLHLLGDIYLQQQEKDHAMNTYILSIVIAHKIQDKLYIHQAIRRIGDAFLALDDITTAISLFETALEGFTEMDIHRGRGECMIRLGDVAHVRREMGKARSLWTDAIPLFQKSEQGKEVIKYENRLQMLEM